MRYRVTVAVICLFACFAAFDASAQTPKPTLNFNWPAPSRASVTEISSKPGRVIKVRYDLGVDQEPASQTLLVSKSNLRILEVNGAVIPEAASRPPDAASTVFPVLRVSLRGEPLEIANLEEYLRDSLNRSGGGERTDVDADLAKMLASESTLRMVIMPLLEPWYVWAGIWAGEPYRLGSVATEHEQLEVAEGVFMPSELTKSYTAVTDSPGRVRARWESVQASTEADAAVKQVVTRLMREQGKDVPRTLRIEDVRKRTIYEALLDLRTLQPQSATFSRTTELTVDGQAHKESTSNSYTFAWSNPKR